VIDGVRGSKGEGVTRTEWFERGLVTGVGRVSGGILAGGFASLAASSPSRSQDVTSLNFALGYEELQAAFYAQALRDGFLRAQWLQFAQTVATHERAHVAYLRQTLGGAAQPSPRFELKRPPASLGEFSRMAVVLEDIGVALYDGQAGNLTARGLAVAAEIMSVESRHASWARAIAGELPAPVASDVPADAAQVRAQLAGAGVGIV